MLKAEDLNMISRHLFPSVNENDCSKLIEFMSQLEEQVVIKNHGELKVVLGNSTYVIPCVG